jgi:hypothetical protein
LPGWRQWLCLPQWLCLSLFLLLLLLLRLGLSLLWHRLGLRLSLLRLRLPLALLRLRLCLLDLTRPGLIPASRLRHRRRHTRQSRRRRPVRNHRPSTHGHRRPSMVGGEELRLVLRRLPLNLHLRRHRSIALLVQHRDLRCSRLYLHAATPAVEAHAIRDSAVDCPVVDHHIVYVHIANHVHIHAIH